MSFQNIAYEWAKGRTLKADAEAVGKSIEAIVAREGVCTPHALVKEAETSGHPLHSHFMWDDAKAGAAYRIHQARNVLNSLTVKVERSEGITETAPAFISVGHRRNSEMAAGYRPIATVVMNPTLRTEALEDVALKLRALERRYGSLAEYQELSPVWEAIRKL